MAIRGESFGVVALPARPCQGSGREYGNDTGIVLLGTIISDRALRAPCPALPGRLHRSGHGKGVERRALPIFGVTKFVRVVIHGRGSSPPSAFGQAANSMTP